MNGVESVDVEEGHVAVEFDSGKIGKEDLFKITKDSMEKLGYKLIDLRLSK